MRRRDREREDDVGIITRTLMATLEGLLKIFYNSK